MEFDFEKTQRIVWQVQDQIDFFEKMRPMLHLDDEDIDEITEQLQDRDFDYLEIDSYVFGGKNEEPSAALVFDGKKDVYWDIFNTHQSKQILEKIQALTPTDAQIEHTRGLTQRDWRKRLKAIYGIDPNDLGLI